MSTSTQSVQCFGKKKTATAVAHCKVSGRESERRFERDGREDLGKLGRSTRMDILRGKRFNIDEEIIVNFGDKDMILGVF